MSHSYCINDEGPAPLASAKQETAKGAMWGRVAHAPTSPPLAAFGLLMLIYCPSSTSVSAQVHKCHQKEGPVSIRYTCSPLPAGGSTALALAPPPHPSIPASCLIKHR